MRKLLLIFLFVSGLIAQASAQDRTVSGKVTSSEDDSTLPGVTVVLKGTTTGTTTDLDGNYKLSVPGDGGILVYSFVGLATQEVEIGSRSVIDLVLQPDAQQLTEIVVTSYGIARSKREVTYQTEKISAEELMIGQPTSAVQGMVGKVAGMQVNIVGNGVKPQNKILLRGLRSISKSNEALIVIDGAIASSQALNDINPNDIESQNVLKGARAAALYGSAGANGAIIIVTKQGGGERFEVGYNTAITFEEVAYMPDFQSQYGTGWDGEYNNIENTNWGPRFDGQTRQIGPTMPDGYVLDTQMVPYAPVKDNLKDFYDTGVTTQHTVSVSGGGEDGSFYVSAGTMDVEGLVPGDTYEKKTFRFNANKKIGKISVGLTSSYMKDARSIVGNEIGDQDRNFYWFVLNTPANIPLSTYSDWDNPESYGHADNYYNAFYQNPYWAAATNRNNDDTERLVANININYDITDNITFSTRLGINTTWGDGKQWRDRQEYDADLQPYHSTVSSFVEDFQFSSREYNGATFLNGKFDLNEDFGINALVGHTFRDQSYRESTIRANNLSIPGFYDISNGTGQLAGEVDAWQKRTFGFVGDVTFDFRDWVFLQVTGRQDYTSTLNKDDRSYFYPSIGLSLVLTDAVPSLSNNVITDIRLTAGNTTVYNDLGAQQINERYSQTRTTPRPFAFPFGPVNGFEVARSTVDAGISKEKINETEFGLDMALVNGRFNFNAAYYITKSTDLITFTTPSAASGAENFLTNIGELEGKGLELSLSGELLKIGDFSWKGFVNYTNQTTTLKEISPGVDEVTVYSPYGTYGTYGIVGETFPTLKAASFVRDPQGRVVVDGTSGDPIQGDLVNMGRVTPPHVVGFGTSMNFKGISFAMTMDYRTGHVYYSEGGDFMEFTGRSQESVAANRQDFVWPNSVVEQADGSYSVNSDVPISGGVMGFWQNTYNEIKENYVKDASALKIREISLNYSFPKALLEKTKILRELRIGFVGRNLMTWLPKENRFSDPEFNNTGEDIANYPTNAIGMGGYRQSSPPTRSYGFNLTAKF